MIAGKSSEISSKVLSEMKEFPLSAVICSEATTLADKIIGPSTPSLCNKTALGDGGEVVASKLTPVESSTTIIDVLLPSQGNSITTVPETPSSSQQEPLQQDITQQEIMRQVPVESVLQAGMASCLATMSMETLNIPSHIDIHVLHHSICVLVSLLFRFPVYFKPLYRLAWLFYKLKAFQVNCMIASIILIVTTRMRYTACKNVSVGTTSN